MVDLNEVRPHDALGSKTPAEVYRDSNRRSLAPLVPSYPAEWKTRRVSRNGNVSVNDDSVFVSMALAGQIVGLHQEDVLRWHCYFFGVDLETIEVIPSLGDVFSSGPVGSIVDRGLPTETTAPSTVNASGTQTEFQKEETVAA